MFFRQFRMGWWSPAVSCHSQCRFGALGAVCAVASNASLLLWGVRFLLVRREFTSTNNPFWLMVGFARQLDDMSPWMYRTCFDHSQPEGV